jgi:subtilisin family serine protease
MVLLIFQSATQEVETQTEGGGSAAQQAANPPTTGREFAKDQIIVELEEGATQADLTALNQRNDARTEENLPRSDVNVVELPSDLTVQEAVQRYESSPDVEYAEPDFLLQPTATPNDPYYSRLYGLNNTGQTNGTPDADVDAKEAWDTTTGVPGTVVAVIDEGVDINHPDLKNNIWVNTDEVPNNGVDDDRNGYVDDRNGYDFANDDASVYDAADGDDHGTHVAGTIAAEGNNGTGVAGVDWRASIMVLKFMGSNGGYTSDAVEALNYAVANGAKISNNSWGGGGSSQALRDAISRADAAGHLVVAAAGNEGTNNDTTPNYPSNFNNPNIVSVAATDDRDILASFSNFGATTVDLAAPGVNILSTLPGNRYGSYSGTSMATPHVTGVAALIKSNSSSLDDAQIKDKILRMVDKKGNLQGTSVTGGRLNAPGAVGGKETELSFSASPLTVNFGGGTLLSGRLTSSGKPLAGKQVILEQRLVGASAFSPVPNGVRITDADGNFSLAGATPIGNTDYRARFADEGPAGLPSSTSLDRRVNVKVVVSLETATTNLELGGAQNISGSVSPAHTGSVKLIIERNGRRLTTKTVTLTSTGYSFSYKPPRTGTYKVSVSVGNDVDHIGSTSAKRSFKVVK